MSKKKLAQTSLDAHASLEPDKIRLMYKKIEQALIDLGPCTFEQIADYWQEDAARIWKRMNEAMKLGLCHRKGDKKPLKSGRLGFVWYYGSGKDITKQRTKKLSGPSVSDFSKAILNQPKLSQNIQTQLF